jgi:uncharacterized protein (DUF427 family)
VKAIVDQKVIADSDDVVECAGYQYFPLSAARFDWLEKAPKTAKDLECPHGVQFYDVVIDGARHPRNAWVYEAPRQNRAETANRIGFWLDVEVK